MEYDEMLEKEHVCSRVTILDAIDDLETLLVLRYEKYCRGYWGGFGELCYTLWKEQYAWGTVKTIRELEEML